jgi:hypothetical protein
MSVPAGVATRGVTPARHSLARPAGTAGAGGPAPCREDGSHRPLTEQSSEGSEGSEGSEEDSEDSESEVG